MEFLPREETLETALTLEGPDRLKALMLWFHADQQETGYHSPRLNTLLDEIQTLDIEASYQLLGLLGPQEMAGYSIINEFGPQFAERACFGFLQRAVAERLQHHGTNAG